MIFSKKGLKSLGYLVPKDRARVIAKLEEYMALDNPMVKSIKIQGTEKNYYRFRVGKYRVIFRKDEETAELVVLVVLRIALRSKVYNKN